MVCFINTPKYTPKNNSGPLFSSIITTKGRQNIISLAFGKDSVLRTLSAFNHISFWVHLVLPPFPGTKKQKTSEIRRSPVSLPFSCLMVPISGWHWRPWFGMLRHSCHLVFKCFDRFGNWREKLMKGSVYIASHF